MERQIALEGGGATDSHKIVEHVMSNWIACANVRLSAINRNAILGGEHLLLHAFYIRSLVEQAGVTYATDEGHDPKMHDMLSVTVDGLRIGFSLEIHTGMHRIAKVTPDFDAIFVMYGPSEAYAGETVYPWYVPETQKKSGKDRLSDSIGGVCPLFNQETCRWPQSSKNEKA